MNNVKEDTKIDMAGWTGEDVKKHVKATRYGFITQPELKIVANDNRTRLELILVRCGGGRFMCPAQDVKHFLEIIEQHNRLIKLLNEWKDAEQEEIECQAMDRVFELVHGCVRGDYVRDVCFPAGA